MIAPEERYLQAVFPEQCLKATPDLEFISNLYVFDMSLCLYRSRLLLGPTSYITQIFTEIFDAINSGSRIPELLVWMQSQVCPTIIVLFILNDFHCTSIETP
jgi:hypothetical protein